MIRFRLVTFAGAVLVAAPGAARLESQAPERPADVAVVRTQLERAYAANADAFRRWDVPGIMALRDSGFHTVAPDGSVRDRAAMEQYTVGLLNGIKQWNSIALTIDSLRLVNAAGDTVVVIMSQHLDRMALRPDNRVHHVETWATQRETWVRHRDRWLLWRVDQVRNQRRLVDGVPE